MAHAPTASTEEWPASIPANEAFSHPDPSQIRQLFIEDLAVPNNAKN